MDTSDTNGEVFDSLCQFGQKLHNSLQYTDMLSSSLSLCYVSLTGTFHAALQDRTSTGSLQLCPARFLFRPRFIVDHSGRTVSVSSLLSCPLSVVVL